MHSREIVRRAIEFDSPPRLPFWQHVAPAAPDDVWEIWEMDRSEAGWFFDNAVMDDWGCQWAKTDQQNMGQVVGYPLEDWSAWDSYRLPDPRNPFYFKNVEAKLGESGDRYVMITSHFNLIERLHMLRGFAAAMQDFYLEPARVESVLDRILQWKLDHFEEAARWFGDRVHGIFLTDDWGTQQGTFVRRQVFDDFFAKRYAAMFEAVHGHGWHVILHSCGRINDFVPCLIEAGVDVLNMQQPRAYDLVEFGEQFRGQVCFTVNADIQKTLPAGDEQEIREEVGLLVKHWGTPEGGILVADPGEPKELGVEPEAIQVMFDEFIKMQNYWQPAGQ